MWAPRRGQDTHLPVHLLLLRSPPASSIPGPKGVTGTGREGLSLGLGTSGRERGRRSCLAGSPWPGAVPRPTDGSGLGG